MIESDGTWKAKPQGNWHQLYSIHAYDEHNMGEHIPAAYIIMSCGNQVICQSINQINQSIKNKQTIRLRTCMLSAIFAS